MLLVMLWLPWCSRLGAFTLSRRCAKAEKHTFRPLTADLCPLHRLAKVKVGAFEGNSCHLTDGRSAVGDNLQCFGAA